MKHMGWAWGLIVIGLACADQTGGDGAAAPAGNTASAGTLLDEVKLDPHSRIEGEVKQTNLVTDDQTQNMAAMTDEHLLNPWGLAFFPQGPAWISANGNSTLDVYDGTGQRLREVMIPPTTPTSDPATPSGQVFNPDPKSFRGDTFIAVSEDGALIGWKSADDGMAVVEQSVPLAVYKGVTIGMAHGRPHLYAANFHAGTIDAFDTNFGPAKLPGSFTDPKIPAGFAPFNVLDVGPFLLVSYAKQDDMQHDDVKGPGNGFVDVFTTEGFFIQRLISQGALNSPWAMVFAPDRGDRGSIDLLVGNFGDGRINVYSLSLRHGQLDADREGALGDTSGHPLVIDGLWGLAFGSGGAGFDASKLYFTAGPNDEADGLFGSLTFVGPRR